MDTHSRRNSIHTSHARRIVRASPSQAISSRQGLALLATIAPNASPHAWPLDRPFDVVANTERIPCNVASPACSRSAAFRVFPLSAAVSAGHVRVPPRDVSECRDRVSGTRGLSQCLPRCSDRCGGPCGCAHSLGLVSRGICSFCPERRVPSRAATILMSILLLGSPKPQQHSTSSAAPAVSRPHSSHL